MSGSCGSVVHPSPLSVEFSSQESWSGLPFPSPGHLPHPKIEPGSPALQADSLLSESLEGGGGGERRQYEKAVYDMIPTI